MNEPVANPFPVVGVGASAGEPLSQLLEGLSSQRRLAVVVVQHLDPHYESQLSSILQTHTPLRVVDAPPRVLFGSWSQMTTRTVAK